MRMKRLTSKTGKGIAALSVGLLTLVGGVPHANADPKWPSALIGHGSDTTQDVVGALAGEESGVFYTPVTSSAASGAKVLNSWDAIGSTACVTPRAPGATIQRGNGSTNGRRILSRSIDGAPWGTEPSCAAKSTVGLVHFARSSSTPSGAGTDLTYIPFGRDALSFGYVANGVAPVTELDKAEIVAIMTTPGGAVIDGVQIHGCGIQTGSGTYDFWLKALGITAGAEDAGTATCNAAGTGARVQENDGAGLKAKSDALPGTQVIIGFSAANYISQNNGVVSTQLPAPAGTVNLGSIDVDGPGGAAPLGVPYVGTVGSPLTPNPTFYADTTFGRDVYNVVPTSKLGPPALANADLKSMFVGSTSAVCMAATTIETFGFKGLGASCGSTTLTGPLVS